MIRSTLKLTLSTSLIFFLSFEPCFSETTQEQRYIKQNQEAAKSSTNQAMFVVHRIKCLNSIGQAALNACNKAMSINSGVPEVRNRKIFLSNKLNPRPKKIRKVIPPPIRQEKPQIRNKPTPKPSTTKLYRKPPKAVKNITRTSPTPKREKSSPKKDNKVVIQIQKILNQLGFNIGKADGIAGKKTKQAIKDFQSITKSESRPNLDDKLLIELQKAQKLHAVADQKYNLANQQLAEGNLEKSALIIETQLKTAPWHINLKSLNKELQQQVVLQEKSRDSKNTNEKLTSAAPSSNTNIDPIKDETPKISSVNDKESQLANIISEAQEMLQNGKLNYSMALVEKGLALNPNQLNLLDLKDKVLLKQNEIQTKKVKDETLSILYSRAFSSFNKSEIDSATAFIDKGLSLDPSHIKLLELKSKILEKRNAARVQNDKDERISNLYARSLDTLQNNDLNRAMSLANEGLSIDSNNQKLFDLKAKIEAKQIEVQVQKENDETLAILYDRSLDSFRNNEIDSAIALVNEGLSLNNNNPKLLELKRDIMLKKDELTASEKKNQKIAMMLRLIEEKQKNLDVMENKSLNEQQTLLFKAQQTLESYHSNNITSEFLSNSSKSVKKKAVESTLNATKVSAPIDYKVDLENLPLSIGKNWILDRGNKTNTKCSLSYRKIRMADGQGGTLVNLSITNDRITFKTESNIDTTYKQTGIKIGDKPQIPIESLLNELSIAYKQQYQSLIKDMLSAKKMTLTLGFWPTWPVTQAYSVNFELENFPSAQQALISCIELENKL
ncbi:peptidoglycan-binding protein [uncultured Cocleimonas sp.]|uniref:peptidoglycan-binding protein n=1 Tax=uncultured Cocleimonas sp. TaxID=1051587 RepID=UPI002610CADC|nr:peptidoglycan-binding protein [uncultured Cocleimonas sp.]